MLLSINLFFLLNLFPLLFLCLNLTPFIMIVSLMLHLYLLLILFIILLLLQTLQPDPLAPINSTILEDHFIDLPKDLSVFIPNDITNTPDFSNDSLSIVPILEFAHTFAPTLASPILGDSFPRRSTRTSRPSAYLQAYKCNATSTKYPIANNISSHTLSSSYSYFCNSISALQELIFYHHAVGDPNWDAAMAAELQALKLNNTWSLVPLPHTKRAVGCKWVFKIKYKSNGSIERYKARLVAKGYTQQEG